MSGPSEVRNSCLQRSSQTETLKRSLELQLAAYKTGDVEVPALSVETVKTTGEKEVLASEPIKVAVQSVLTGKQDTLKDLKPQAEIEADYKPFLFFLVALASAALSCLSTHSVLQTPQEGARAQT